MDCKEFSNLLDAWMDGTLPDGDAERMRDHAAACDDCASLYMLRMDCRRLDEEIEAPQAFSSSWRQMIREEAQKEEQTEEPAETPRRKWNWRAWLTVAAALVFVIGGALITRGMLPVRPKHSSVPNADAIIDGEARHKSTDDDGQTDAKLGDMLATGETATNVVFEDAGAPMEIYGEAEFAFYEDETAEVESLADTQAFALAALTPPASQTSLPAALAPALTAPKEAALPEEKIIRSASFTLHTTAYDAALNGIQSLTAEMGGRVESLTANGDEAPGQPRSADLTLRIPSGRLDEFLASAQDIGSLTDVTQAREDITAPYRDAQARLEAQRERLEGLRELMAQAEDENDLAAMENALAEIRYFIESDAGLLADYDSQADESTVSVSVQEIR